ncbi:hypothetical protein PHYBLDRAFT_175221 [Phycomyces blakesleeanus NRRL 1555(-)]|uniref:Uncharacterized protein n=1 Tax=Phycomyces blakesleeanus (strain ATCC 8743b / DSM 1359 / FGSC 10004 / NBRC 33097 / NRRL 1555) TaxID=763407 RepID=A0A162ZF97_PHYB8|nr:hypothetical protein PHYBLDRAFT_175221 [Phycomyces blakesleeanus NRRL 1555(-)]OAD66411.1 hypothetical protein PHYBLDRAFT_175221 [Phycomyces blakesleeanus NRRL 1555(-)]|eukprot:XP_018284451.1 hypothetical protein PHYBLDRAFT_175221 [Phycomyces blakesleeanus NRRL 1555(-)]
MGQIMFMTRRVRMRINYQNMKIGEMEKVVLTSKTERDTISVSLYTVSEQNRTVIRVKQLFLFYDSTYEDNTGNTAVEHVPRYVCPCVCDILLSKRRHGFHGHATLTLIG